MYGTANSIHSLVWSVRRWLGRSPMQKLIRELQWRGITLEHLDGLEVFGGDGTRHTIDYAARLRSLKVWEVDPLCVAGLKKNLPFAEVRNVDSYVEMDKTNRTFSLVVLDNSVSLFGPGNCYCEHFEIFAPMLRTLASPALIILNLLPEVNVQHNSGSDSQKEHLMRRRRFYEVDDSCVIGLERMVQSYRQKLSSQGWELKWQFSQQRTVRSKVHYLVMQVARAK